MKKIVLATGNAGKIAELKTLLTAYECLPQSAYDIGSIDETGLSFVENALLKARHASRLSGLPALADDSGLVVEALNGAPGIYSSRFAGETATDADNIALLLDKLSHIPANQRQAFFYCALVIVRHAADPMPIIACGSIEGVIAQTPSGQHGFGYDPVFYLPAYQCTMAECPASLKNTISHRAQALSQLQQQLNLLNHDY